MDDSSSEKASSQHNIEKIKSSSTSHNVKDTDDVQEEVEVLQEKPVEEEDKKPTLVQLEERFKRYLSETDLLRRELTKKKSFTGPIKAHLCDSDQLLRKNTSSFRCLAQLLISSSSLTKNRLFLFPPLEDPGISLAFYFQEPAPIVDNIGIEKYKKLCYNMDIVPITRIINSLNSDTLDLKYYGLSLKQMRALTEILKTNSHIETLILQDNWLSLDMVQLISDMLAENLSIHCLSLRECRIGAEGAQRLGEILGGTQSIESLDLSYNDLNDEGLQCLKDGLCENSTIQYLNLGHNNITEESADVMKSIFTENKCLEVLDLSWSGFYTVPACKKFFTGLLQNDHIKSLNLSWNGIGAVGAVRPITRYLKKAENLVELDLSSNRLDGRCARMLKAAINKNKSLKTIKLGNNKFGPDEAHGLLAMLAGKAKDPLQHLDMENMYIKKASKPLLNTIKRIGKTVRIGGVLSDFKIVGPDRKKLIYERCRYILTKPKQKKAKRDIGHFLLMLPEQGISPEEFKKRLKKQKIKKLDKDLLEALMNLFVTKRKEVDCRALVKDYMEYYPDTQLPPPIPKKSKGKKKKGKAAKENKEEEMKVHDLEAGINKDMENEAGTKAIENVTEG